MGLRYPGGVVTATFNPFPLNGPSSAVVFPIEVFVLAGGGGGGGGFQPLSVGYVVGTTYTVTVGSGGTEI